MNAYLAAMRKYVTFSGRARRSEYWLFCLVVTLMSIAASILDVLIFGSSIEYSGPLGGLVMLVHLLPSLAVTVRRIHDIDRTGWWLLLSFTGIGYIVIFIFSLLRGTIGPNRYGPDPIPGA